MSLTRPQTACLPAYRCPCCCVLAPSQTACLSACVPLPMQGSQLTLMQCRIMPVKPARLAVYIGCSAARSATTNHTRAASAGGRRYSSRALLICTSVISASRTRL